MNELKPCPFCPNGDGVLIKYRCGAGIVYDVVQCQICGAMGPSVPERLNCPERAIDGWNRRPAPENVRNLLETIHTLRNEKAALKARYDEINRYNISCTKKIDELLAEKVAPENKPLTLEQLRQMDGEPVYIVVDGRPDLNAWHMVRRTDVGIIAIGAAAQTIYNYDGKLIFEGGTYYDIEHGNLYGKTWLAYARKSEQEATS